ncbi:MAG: TIGR03915 family putative DNA repair protein [Oscillospiraceae bacterium]|jgi:probable DNA metabolism protein|nr:TIGR03915 family putative DNA repair protein [Oscillospiraceae bacterium]
MTTLIYDGTWEGLLCAVFHVFAHREGEWSIRRGEAELPGLFPAEYAAVDAQKARRVEGGMKKLGRDVPEQLYTAWLSEFEGVEDAIAGFMRVGFDEGIDPNINLLHPDVRLVRKAFQAAGWEAQRMRQFVRFVKAPGPVFVADIEPVCNVLTLIAAHFHGRFNDQRFIIRDIRRRLALISRPEGWHISDLGQESLPPLPEDGAFEQMWRGYFKAISNPARKNKKLQQKFIPLRYRAHLTEFQE